MANLDREYLDTEYKEGHHDEHNGCVGFPSAAG